MIYGRFWLRFICRCKKTRLRSYKAVLVLLGVIACLEVSGEELQSRRSSTSVQKAPSARVSKKNRVLGALRKSFYQSDVSYILWQEDISFLTPTGEGRMKTHFHGFNFGLQYRKPFRRFRWIRSYSLDAALGVAKGQALQGDSNSLANQPWLALSFSPGLSYRTSMRTELGLFLPLVYRSIQWNLDSDVGLSLKDKAFSAGLSGVFLSRFNLRSSLAFSITHQYMWNASLWQIGWKRDFR